MKVVQQEIRALGQSTTTFEGFDRIAKPEGVVMVTLTSDELVSFCPVTRQPDVSSVQVSYRPGDWIVETKTFKLYLNSFRDRGIFAEDMAAEIAKKMGEDLEADEVNVYLKQHPRGGITTDVVAQYRGLQHDS